MFTRIYRRALKATAGISGLLNPQEALAPAILIGDDCWSDPDPPIRHLIGHVGNMTAVPLSLLLPQRTPSLAAQQRRVVHDVVPLDA